MSRTFTKNVSNFASYGAAQVGPLLNGATKFAVAAWVNPAGFSTSSNVDNNIIAFCVDAALAGFSLGVDASSGTARVAVNARSRAADARQTRIGTARTVTLGGWQLIGADVDVAGDTMTPRHNGVADNGGAVTFGASTYTQGTATGIDRVGADVNGAAPAGTNFQWAGDIAHLIVWKFTGSDAGLSQSDWDSLAAGVDPSTIQPTKVVLYTPIGGTASPETSTVGGLSLTLTGSVPAGATAPPDGGGVTISLSDVADTRIVQRSGTSGSLALSGTHNAATSVQARVVQHGTSTEVVGWTTIDAAPGAATWSGTLSGIPQGGWYNVQVRQGNNTIIAANGTARFGVGALFCLAGQSNSMKWFNVGSGTPAALTSKYTGSWATNTGAGAIAFANAMASALGVPVGLLDTGVDGAALTSGGDRGYGYWLNTSGTPYTTWQSRVTGAGGKLEGILWLQGEADAFQAVAGATYTAGLATLFGRFRSHTGQASLPVFLAPLPRTSHADADDAAWNAINDCILAAGTATEVVAADTWDLPLADTVHYSTTGYTTLAGRVALAVRKYKGEAVESRGPYIASVQYLGSQINVNMTHRGGSDISPASGITGLRFTSGGSAITPTSVVRSSATQITATFAAPVTAPVTVAVAWGMTPDATSVPADDDGLPLSKTASAGVSGVDEAKTVSLTLTTDGTTPAASLSGLRWAFFDQALPNDFLAPSAQGAGATTNGSGVLAVDVTASALAVGQTGWLIVTNSDGTTGQSPPAKAFSGPVAVS